MMTMRKMIAATIAVALAVALQGCGGSEEKKTELKEELNKAVGAWNDEAAKNDILKDVKIAQKDVKDVPEIAAALEQAKTDAAAKIDAAVEPKKEAIDAANKLVERLEGLIKKAAASKKEESKKEESKKEESKKVEEKKEESKDASSKKKESQGRLEPNEAPKVDA